MSNSENNNGHLTAQEAWEQEEQLWAAELQCSERIENFKAGVHGVFVSEDSGVPYPDEFLSKRKFCNIEYQYIPGDLDVGIYSWQGWVLSDNQKDTSLEKLINNYNKIEKIKLLFKDPPVTIHEALNLIEKIVEE